MMYNIADTLLNCVHWNFSSFVLITLFQLTKAFETIKGGFNNPYTILSP